MSVRVSAAETETELLLLEDGGGDGVSVAAGVAVAAGDSVIPAETLEVREPAAEKLATLLGVMVALDSDVLEAIPEPDTVKPDDGEAAAVVDCPAEPVGVSVRVSAAETETELLLLDDGGGDGVSVAAGVAVAAGDSVIAAETLEVRESAAETLATLLGVIVALDSDVLEAVPVSDAVDPDDGETAAVVD